MSSENETNAEALDQIATTQREVRWAMANVERAPHQATDSQHYFESVLKGNSREIRKLDAIPLQQRKATHKLNRAALFEEITDARIVCADDRTALHRAEPRLSNAKRRLKALIRRVRE